MAGGQGRKFSVPKEGTGGTGPRPPCWTMRQQQAHLKKSETKAVTFVRGETAYRFIGRGITDAPNNMFYTQSNQKAEPEHLSAGQGLRRNPTGVWLRSSRGKTGEFEQVSQVRALACITK